MVSSGLLEIPRIPGHDRLRRMTHCCWGSSSLGGLGNVLDKELIRTDIPFDKTLPNQTYLH